MTSSHCGPKVIGWYKPVLASQQKGLRRQLGAALATTSCQDCSTCTCLHTKTETVGLSATTSVWLKGTLAHVVLLQNFLWIQVKFWSKALSEPNAEQPVKLTAIQHCRSSFIRKFLFSLFKALPLIFAPLITFWKKVPKKWSWICNFIPLSSWILRDSFPQSLHLDDCGLSTSYTQVLIPVDNIVENFLRPSNQLSFERH